MSPGLIYGLIFFASLLFVMFAFEAWKHRREMRNRPPPVLFPRELLALAGVPSIVLTATGEPAFSKIGGAPELSADLPWPQGEKGPREFLIQIDLAEARSWGGPDWLPATGRIYVFHDDERAGFADHACVLFTADLPGPPQGFTAPPYRERRLTGRSYMSYPSPEWLGVDGVDGEDEDLSQFVIEPETVGREGMHRMSGFPSEIQGGRMSIECEHLSRGLDLSYAEPIPAEIEEAAKSWRLLLQIDSDDELKMNWWDSGRFYVFIREEDARAGDFSKTVTISQSY